LFAVTLKEYDPLEKAVNAALKTVVDAESKTAGWQELIDLSRDQANLRAALIDRSASEQQRAHREPDLRSTFGVACRPMASAAAETTTMRPPSFSNHRRSGIHDAPII